MPTQAIDADFARMLREARSRATASSRAALDRIDQALEDARRSIEFDLEASDNPLTQEKARQLRQQIGAVLAGFGTTAAETTDRSVRQIVDDVAQLHQQVTRELATRYHPPDQASLLDRFALLAGASLLLLLVRAGQRATVRTMLADHLAEGTADLDRFIAAALERGVSSRQLLRDFSALLTDGIPPPTAVYGLPYTDLSGLGTIRPDTERIAVSESFTALRESNAQALNASPIVVAMRWCLSRRHVVVDECDLLASLDFYHLGEGWYPTGRYPKAPHPRCQCFCCATLSRAPGEWGTQKPGAVLRQDPGGLDFQEVGLGAEKWSDLRGERARQTLSRSIFLSDLPARRRIP